MRSLRRLLGYLRPELTVMCVVVLLSFTGILINVTAPRILGRGTDIIFTGVIGQHLPAGVSKQQAIAELRASDQTTFARLVARLNVVPGQGIDFRHLARILMLAIGLYLIAASALWLQGYLLNGAVQRAIFSIRDAVEVKVHRLPLSYLDKMERGELLSRVTNDIDNVSQMLQQAVSQALTSLLTVVGVTVMMFVISPPLAVVALLTIPISLLVAGTIARRAQKQFAQQWKQTGQLNALIEEAFTGHSLVKVYGRRAKVEASFAQKNQELFTASFAGQFMSGLTMPAMMFIGNLSYVAVAVVGGLRVATGTMNLGDVQAFIQYSWMFTQPLSQLAAIANVLQSGVASAERVFELLDAPEESPDVVGKVRPTRGRIEFEQVSFAYDRDKPLISNLSLVAKPGQTVAIVGPTGAGKTTLVNLIMRFYEVDAGRITIDGVDIREVPRPVLRSNIGMVLQDTWLFHGTIRDNIAYGRPTATEAEILAAAKASYADRFVHSLAHGYDTVIDEQGSNISAGEKQLLTIARAFLANPALLILDEATSSVDTRTEVLVQRAMAALRSDRTSFVIAHRLSTIRDADVILMMKDGAIVEHGGHAELLAAQGRYYALYHSQFVGADEAAAEDSAARS
jgi:ATP-binding cassette subfamily B protein